MKVIKILSILILIFTFSCTSLLEDVEPTSIITTASFFKTEDDAKGAVLGMYVSLRDRTNDDYYFMGEARSEMLTEGKQAPEGNELYYLNTLQAVNIRLRWVGWYRIIHDANLIIENVPNIEFANESEKDKILAQAYAMRAFVYFTLGKCWGGVPIVTDPTKGFDPGNQFLSKASIEELINFVKSDIDQSLALFKGDNSFPSGRVQWSKPAVNALKGEVYLWSGKLMGGGNADFSTALAALQEVQTADVALMDDFRDVFDIEGNDEFLMSVSYTENESGSMWGQRMFVAQTDVVTFTNPAYNEIIGAGGGLNRIAFSKFARDQFTDDDSRKDNTFIEIYIPDPNVAGDSIFHAVAQTKFVGKIINGLHSWVDNDVILYRYADVLLMIAEAKNALGQDPTTEINMVRQRAYGDNFPAHQFVNGSKEANDAAILQERFFEFAYEAKRWFDLVRFGKVFELVPSLQDRPDPNLLLFPISIETLSLNPNLVQNPGY